MKITLLILIFVAIAFICSYASDYHNCDSYLCFNDNLLNEICKEISGSGQCFEAIENYKSNYDNKYFSRKKDTLIVKLLNGKLLFFKDNNDDLKIKNIKDFKSYYYVKYYKDTHFILLSIHYYETLDFILINAFTGKTFKIWGEPVFSPDKKRFVTISWDLFRKMDDTGYQIWKIKENNIILECEKKLSDWGPENASWINNSTIKFKIKRFNIIEDKYYLINYKNNKWQ